eukprot:Sspe_Gene.8777::Locus_2965_Transcript_1_1_Confidence_1.000_Length_1400::g.8777::m.8777
MPCFDELVVNWAVNAVISKDDKVKILKSSREGHADFKTLLNREHSEPFEELAARELARLSGDETEEQNGGAGMENGHAPPKYIKDIEQVTLRDGTQLPPIGTGSYVGNMEHNNSKEHAYALVKEALEIGYRLFDCAAFYLNEEEFGEALKRAFDEGEVKRDDVFIVTKIAHPNDEARGYDESPYMTDPDVDAVEGVYNAVQESRRRLQLDCIDMVLIHWPGAFGSTDKEFNKTKRYEMWKGLEKAKRDGLVRQIGVSNFTLEHYDELVGQGVDELPCLNQIEVNPYLVRESFIAGCKQRGMAVMAYCPLGSGNGVLDDRVIDDIAIEHNVMPAQAILRWHVHRGIIPIPKSTNPERMSLNLSSIAGNFELSEEECDRISALDRNQFVCPDPANIA